jgi:hypothetical protein
MHISILATTVAMGFALATVPAQPAAAQDYSASRIIDSFDIAKLRAVVDQLDATIVEKSDGGFRITFANGTVSSAEFTACREDTCLGTHLTATFSKPSDKTVSQTETLVRDYNRNNRTLTVYNLGNGRSQADLYIIADGGITMKNYLRQLSLYAYSLKKYRGAIYTGG